MYTNLLRDFNDISRPERTSHSLNEMVYRDVNMVNTLVVVTFTEAKKKHPRN